MTDRLTEQVRPDAALFIDWDNLKAGLKTMGRQPNVSSLLDAVGQRGRVVVARAYADWQQKVHTFDPPNLYAAGIEPVYVPVRMQGGKILKNSADVKLAVDCIDFLNTAPHLKTFILVSGDADLMHLVNFLRARGKRVIVIAVSNSLSQALSENVDEIILYDIDIEPGQKAEPAANGRKPKQSAEPAPQLDEAFQVLTDLLKNRTNRVGSLFSWVGIQLGRRGVDLRALGFERLRDFIREAERKGYVRTVTRGLQDWVFLPDQYEQMMDEEEVTDEEEAQEEEGSSPSEVSVSALDEDEQTVLMRYFVDLERRSEYLIPPYIVSHLVRHNVLPSLSQAQLRSLVRSALDEGLLLPSTHTVPHKQTGKPHELRTVRVNPEHPLAQSALEQIEV